MPIGEDALGGYTFKIEIDGQVIAQFKEVSGLGASREVIEHRELNLMGKEVIKKLPGKKSWEDIVLKRGVTDSTAVDDWFGEILKGNVDAARKNGSIVLYDYAGGEVRRYNFKNAWPNKVSVSGLQAGSSDIAVEEVTLSHEGLEPA
ncbi:MAG: phage tail protein [Ilumatobacter sp.]|uniref:phage tail protein n=1 Tax=Ilumatobacter sp. TaxID=1967498 RepID=UPI00262B4966|nr:phage tail protein [Ilumatobacter sp.]MDJ0770660.1 phage tail protein [Ilumatobacter sp.]